MTKLLGMLDVRAILLVSLLFAAPAWAADSDGDGVADAQDNCYATANSDQYDADGNGVVDAIDASIIQAAMGSTEDDDYFDARADHDGDGQVLVSDYQTFLSSYPGS